MVLFRFILITIMLCLAGSVQAQCQHPDAELQAYAFQLNQGSLPGILTTHVKFSVENDHHVQVVLNRGDMPARTLKPLTLKNSVTAPVKSSVYRALIIPPKPLSI